jgi:hypothetical protein
MMGTAQGSPQAGAGGVPGSVREAAQGVASKAGEAWETTRQGAQHMASSLAGGTEEAWGSLDSFVHRYPFWTIGIGFCLGFALERAIRGFRPSSYNWQTSDPRYNPTSAGMSQDAAERGPALRIARPALREPT